MVIEINWMEIHLGFDKMKREKKTHKKSLAFCSQRGMNWAKSILILSMAVIAVGLLVDWFEFFT